MVARLLDFAPLIPLDAIPIVVTPGVHMIALWSDRGPWRRPTLTGSVQAFGALMAHNLAAAYRPEVMPW